ncbi:MAG TPA: CobW family GTP-binding protein [Novosphingobium sp.]|nr:CobW family GTP-binding protein [Novosphingobium sp.]
MREPPVPVPVPVPATILAGYLGAGKTTTVNHLLRHAGGRRLLVLVNDFGALPIDGDLIAGREGGVITLANGCACCQVGQDLLGALARALAGPARPDHLLIEASGIADPVQLAQLAQAEPLLRLDAVATLVDAAGIRQRLADRWAGATVRRQIGAAGLLVLNKADLVAPEELAALCALLADLAPGAARLATRQGRVAPDLLLGPAGWRSAPGPTGAGHGYRSWSGRAGGAIPPAAMRAFLAALPEWVHRVKGIAPDPAGSAYACHRVGRQVAIEAAPAGTDPAARIVAIGPAGPFAPAVLESAWAALCGS